MSDTSPPTKLVHQHLTLQSTSQQSTMHKTTLLILAVCAASASAYEVVVKNNQGWASTFPVASGDRWCFCVKNTQTASIKGNGGGDIKLFSKDDCTGNFVQLGSNSQQNNAQWVNSFSMGASGIPSGGPNGICPNWFDSAHYP
ncbi:hypothetical protein BGZ83_006134 [Gryganskiella cystojenkinii]|nr:hypothetical protein BGZ83_006134 [Gryganskiella cystojenkinii]